jgi:cell division transport system ATP-binding protein
VVVRFENVFMRYEGGPVILRDVSFDLEPGSFHFLTGASGAGKSTLLRLMYLAARPVSGVVTMFGRDTTKVPRAERPEFRRRVGVVFQDFRLLPHLSAIDNVALPLRIAGTREALIREHVPELLAWVGLSGHLDALPATLSGGQQQRIAIARAVIGRPALLLADEPTGNVDDRIAVPVRGTAQDGHHRGHRDPQRGAGRPVRPSPPAPRACPHHPPDGVQRDAPAAAARWRAPRTVGLR